MAIGPEGEPDQFVRDLEKAKKWDKIENTVDSACKGALLSSDDSNHVKKPLSLLKWRLYVEPKMNLVWQDAKRRNVVWSSHKVKSSKTEQVCQLLTLASLEKISTSEKGKSCVLSKPAKCLSIVKQVSSDPI